MRVLAVAPGTIDTAFQREPGNVQIWQTWASKIPVGRIGRPEEIAATVAFLAGEGATALTGQILQPNGGTTRSPA